MSPRRQSLKEPFAYGLHSLEIAGGGKVDYWVISKRFSFIIFPSISLVSYDSEE